MLNVVFLVSLLTLLQLAESNAEVNALKAMVENAVAFFLHQRLLYNRLSPSTTGWLADSAL
jgi:hypothetical protein